MEMAQREVLTLLSNLRIGDAGAAGKLESLVSGELRQLVARHMRMERPGTPLRPSVLLNAAFVEIAEERDVSWECRAHFLGMGALVLRQVLTEYAREHRSRRGLETAVLALDGELAYTEDQSSALLALHEALERLARIDWQKSRILELRFFGGLSVEETAHVVGRPAGVVKRECGMAREWVRGSIVERH